MSVKTGILIAIIVILVVCMVHKCWAGNDTTMCNCGRYRGWHRRCGGCYEHLTNKINPAYEYLTSDINKHDSNNIKSHTRAENMATAEYFQQCMAATELGHNINCAAEATDGYRYSANDFGEPDSDYKDWIMQYAIDPQVVKNHKEFVADRINDKTQNITGRTFALGELESDQIKWWGIRGRPVGVAVCNPDQVADVNHEWYATKHKCM